MHQPFLLEALAIRWGLVRSVLPFECYEIISSAIANEFSRNTQAFWHSVFHVSVIPQELKGIYAIRTALRCDQINARSSVRSLHMWDLMNVHVTSGLARRNNSLADLYLPIACQPSQKRGNLHARTSSALIPRQPRIDSVDTGDHSVDRQTAPPLRQHQELARGDFLECLDTVRQTRS